VDEGWSNQKTRAEEKRGSSTYNNARRALAGEFCEMMEELWAESSGVDMTFVLLRRRKVEVEAGGCCTVA